MPILQKDFILFSGYGGERKISYCYWLESYKAKEKWGNSYVAFLKGEKMNSKIADLILEII